MYLSHLFNITLNDKYDAEHNTRTRLSRQWLHIQSMAHNRQKSSR